MATGYYFLVGVLALTALVSGQADVPVEGYPQFPDRINEIYPDFRPMLDSMVGNPFLCKACEDVIGFLKNVTDNKQVLDDLVNLLLPLCDWAPYRLHSECVTFVEGIPDMVKMYVDMYLNPQTDCAFVCQSSGMNVDPNVPIMMSNLMKMMQKKPIN